MAIIVKLIDSHTKESVNYAETSVWWDGTAMDDTKVDNVIYRKKSDKYYVDCNFNETGEIQINRYGLLADNTFRSISTVFPNVTLSDVQALNNTATLSNSADWYIIQKLVKTLPANCTILLNGIYQIDKDIVISSGDISIIGKGRRYSRSNSQVFETGQTVIHQISENTNGITIADGDGSREAVNYVTRIHIQNIFFMGIYSGNGFDISLTNGTLFNVRMEYVQFWRFNYGLKHITGHINNFYFYNCFFSYNTINGFDVNSTSQSQVNGLSLMDCWADGNGVSVNNPESPDYSYGIGFKINGTSHNLRIGGHVNKTAGLLIPDNYIFGCNITGYFEGSGISELICLVNTYEEYLKDTIINIYASNINYFFTNENIKKKAMPSYYCKVLEDRINALVTANSLIES